MQKLARKLVASISGWQIRRLSKRYSFKVVAVAGSIGKTSTKLAVATVLQQKYRVLYQHGNYNDLVSVPLIYFGHDFEEEDRLPFLYNPISWLKIFWQNEKMLQKGYPYDIVIIELGPDGPGQMEPFKAYVKADIGVLTAISPEHMQFFGDIETVAKEEMIIAELSEKLFYNSSLVSSKYISKSPIPVIAYGDYPAKDFKGDWFSESHLYSASAAAIVGQELGLTKKEIQAGLNDIKPEKGRMQRLKGINGSTILDDSYNASPRAMKTALDTLYEADAPQKIAVLGNMNELGSHSPAEHKKVGQYCDPQKIDLVITLGPDANKYLAPAAKAKGNKVQSFEDPFTLGKFLKSVIGKNGAVLVKGSQNKVFAEEAIKFVLANPADARKLVRQSPRWLKIKQDNFKKT